MGSIFATAALALIQPAAAVPDAMERLDQLVPGTAAERVHALFPAGPKVRHAADRVAIEDVAVGGDCEGDAEIRLARGAVSEVELRGGGALLGRCGERVLEALVARLGAPDEERSRGDTPWRRARSTYAWNRDGRAIRYVRYTSPGYAGTGLLSASWVLTVSPGGAKD
jgi:hypothetical protein